MDSWKKASARRVANIYGAREVGVSSKCSVGLAIATLAFALVCPLVTYADDAPQPPTEAGAALPPQTPAPHVDRPSEITIKLDPVSTLQVVPKSDSGWSPKDLAAFVISALTSIVALAAMLLTWWTSRKAVVQRINEEEVASIQGKLNTFYGPYQQLSNTNKLLAEELHRGKSEDFRTLSALLDPALRTTLSKDDQVLVDEIVKNAKRLDTLISKKAGIVDPQVQEYLWRASAHFRIIQLAHAGSIPPSDETRARFNPYVYPRAVEYH